MKLRNKKTGVIGELSGVNRIVVYEPDMPLCENSILGEYDTLAELNKDWEDYKIDPYIVDMLEDNCISSVAFGTDLQEIERAKECGLYFESKEEAEKAVEKLKSLKRLKDKEFRFDGYDIANRAGDNVICGQAYFKAGNYDKEGIKKDLDLLFGGKE